MLYALVDVGVCTIGGVPPDPGCMGDGNEDGGCGGAWHDEHDDDDFDGRR